MDPARVKAWQRFRDQVLRPTEWPRGLWFTAVEDGLQAALGAESRLLADYRQDVAELLDIERAASGSYRDEKRIGQLEAQIKQIIDLTDQRMTSGGDRGTLPGPEEAARRRSIAVPVPVGPAGALILGLLLILAGAGGTTAYYEFRLAAQTERQAARMTDILDQRVADRRAELDQRLRVAGQLNQRIAALQSALGDHVDQFNATMAESVRSVLALGDNAIAELERRLEAKDGSVVQALGRLEARLDQLGAGVAALEQRLPAMSEQFERVASEMQQAQVKIQGTAKQIDALQSAGPAMSKWLDGQREGLQQEIETRQAALGTISSEMTDLKGEVDQSRGRLVEFDRSLDQSLEQARLDGEALKKTVHDMRATGQELDELMAGAQAKVEAAHQEMGKKIDQILSDLAEKADLAASRGQDAIERARAEISRKADAESRQTLEVLVRARDERLAQLTKLSADTQAEIERTGAGLVAGWQRMDQTVAARQGAVLSQLDGYASTIEAQVRQLLDALDVSLARTGG